VAHHCPCLGKGLIVQRQVELGGRQVGPEGAADLNGPDRSAGDGAPAEPLEHLSQGDSEGGLDDPAARDVAGQLEDLGAA
jgi:hypothetical protein